MKYVTLEFLANDFKTSSYTNPGDCAMTRALKRCDIPAEEAGGVIVHDEIYHDDRSISTPKGLALKVMGMYKYLDLKKDDTSWNKLGDTSVKALKPRNFTFRLAVPETWIQS